MSNKQKFDGQIWIDKYTPHSMWYYVDGRNFKVEVSPTYLKRAGVDLQIGNLVKFEAPSIISLASFPEDMKKTLGVVSSMTTDEATGRVVAEVVTEGNIEVDASVFFAEDILTFQNYEELEELMGIPVYWYIGKILPSFANNADNAYHYEPSGAGKLTITTPCGINELTPTEDIDPRINIGYDNLPRVGTIAYVIRNENDPLLSKIGLHLGVGPMDTSFEWHWPYKHLAGNNCGLISTTNGVGSIKLYHGLFGEMGNGAASVKPRGTSVDVTASPSHGSPHRVSVLPYIKDNFRQGSTEITVKTPENLYYTASGVVNFDFDI